MDPTALTDILAPALITVAAFVANVANPRDLMLFAGLR